MNRPPHHPTTPPGDDDPIRYPIGRPVRPTGALAPEGIRQAIDGIAGTPARAAAVVAGLDDPQLDTPYRRDGWTPRQIIHHLADSHQHAFIRLRFALLDHRPTIMPYDENRWAGLADCRLPVEPSLQILAGLHQRWVAVLRHLGPDDWERPFLHPESGSWRIGEQILLYDWHGRQHLAHIAGLRARRGW